MVNDGRALERVPATVDSRFPVVFQDWGVNRSRSRCRFRHGLGPIDGLISLLDLCLNDRSIDRLSHLLIDGARVIGVVTVLGKPKGGKSPLAKKHGQRRRQRLGRSAVDNRRKDPSKHGNPSL